VCLTYDHHIASLQSEIVDIPPPIRNPGQPCCRKTTVFTTPTEAFGLDYRRSFQRWVTGERARCITPIICAKLSPAR